MRRLVSSIRGNVQISSGHRLVLPRGFSPSNLYPSELPTLPLAPDRCLCLGNMDQRDFGVLEESAFVRLLAVV